MQHFLLLEKVSGAGTAKQKADLVKRHQLAGVGGSDDDASGLRFCDAPFIALRRFPERSYEVSDRLLASGLQPSSGCADHCRDRGFQPQRDAFTNLEHPAGSMKGTGPEHNKCGDPSANHQLHEERHGPLLF